MATFSEEAIDQIQGLLESNERNIKQLRSILLEREKPVAPCQQSINQVFSGEKPIPLFYGENYVKVGYYSAQIMGDRRVVKLVPLDCVQWSCKPIQWFLDQVKASNYSVDTSFHDCIVVEVPKKGKYGNILNQAAWAFHAMNNLWEDEE